MIALAWTLLTTRASGPIAAAVAAVLLVVSGCQTVRLTGAQNNLERTEKQLASARAQYSLCQTNRAGLEASIQEQNAEVEAFARIQNERVIAATKAVQLAAKGRVDAERRAAELLKNQPTGVDSCARFMSADRAVLDSLR